MKKLTALLMILVLLLSCTACSGMKFKEQVAMDNDDILVTITGIDTEDEDYFKMNFLVENLSDGKLVCDIYDICVNGNDYDESCTISAGAGERTDGALRFYYEDCLEEYGEERATKISFTLEVLDENYEELYETQVAVYPYGERAAD